MMDLTSHLEKKWRAIHLRACSMPGLLSVQCQNWPINIILHFKVSISRRLQISNIKCCILHLLRILSSRWNMIIEIILSLAANISPIQDYRQSWWKITFHVLVMTPGSEPFTNMLIICMTVSLPGIGALIYLGVNWTGSWSTGLF